MKLIPVTRAHIDAGHPRTCTSCPVALALRDATGAQRLDCHWRERVLRQPIARAGAAASGPRLYQRVRQRRAWAAV